jgi:hypothetical protein
VGRLKTSPPPSSSFIKSGASRSRMDSEFQRKMYHELYQVLLFDKEMLVLFDRE